MYIYLLFKQIREHFYLRQVNVILLMLTNTNYTPILETQV
jgi:hypothetical protein